MTSPHLIAPPPVSTPAELKRTGRVRGLPAGSAQGSVAAPGSNVAPVRRAVDLLDLGLWYMIFTALALGLVFHIGGVPISPIVVPEISWIGAVILIFAAMVPTTPKKMLIAGLIAASMNPVGMGQQSGQTGARPAELRSPILELPQCRPASIP